MLLNILWPQRLIFFMNTHLKEIFTLQRRYGQRSHVDLWWNRTLKFHHLEKFLRGASLKEFCCIGIGSGGVTSARLVVHDVRQS